MNTIKLELIESQAVIENIHDILKKAQIEIIKQGEKFLEKYTNDNIGIMLFDNEKLAKIMSDLHIVEKVDDDLSLFTTIFHKVITDKNDEQYRILYCHPDKISPSCRKTGLAYVIGSIMFTNEFNQKTIEFEIPNSFSSKTDLAQQTFIYSIMIPYKEYRSCFIDFLINKINNIEISTMYIQAEWIHYLANHTGCTVYDVASAINNLYSRLYFDELNAIWNNYIGKALDYNYMNPSSPYQVPTSHNNTVTAIDSSENKQKHIEKLTS